MVVENETELPPLTVYSRNGCHLCDVLIEQLLPLARGIISVDVIDIDTSAELQENYGSRVPVVAYDENVICQYSLDVTAVQSLLAELRASIP